MIEILPTLKNNQKFLLFYFKEMIFTLIKIKIFTVWYQKNSKLSKIRFDKRIEKKIK